MHGVKTATSAPWRNLYHQCLLMTFRPNTAYSGNIEALNTMVVVP